MNFHARTIEFLGSSPAAGDASGVLDAEALLGIDFPAAVREWYVEIDGRTLLEKHSNQDPARAPLDFALEMIDGRRLVVFQIENQGVCWWAFDPDSGDDPAVYVNLDPWTEGDPKPDKVFLYTPTFSDFTFIRAFDFEGFHDPDRTHAEICRPLEEEDLGVLRGRFAEQPRSRGWPGDEQYRFQAENGRITIWSWDQADWNLTADSAKGLDELIRSVRDIWRPFQ